MIQARALAFAILALSGVAHGASLDHKGTEFILGFMPNFPGFVPQAIKPELLLSSETSTDVVIEYPLGEVRDTRNVGPGAVEVISIPQSYAQDWTPNEVSSALVIRVSATNEFAVTLANRKDTSTDAALGLPVDTMNTEYIVTDYNPLPRGSQFQSHFLVYAAYDDTTVTITPATAIIGHPAGMPFQVQLNRGEAYFAQSQTTQPENTLTGTLVSSNRPVGMANGHYCAFVDTDTSACDHLFEVSPPVQSWGMEIGVANLPQRPGGSIYRVVASQDDTAVTLDGSPLDKLANAGDFFETEIIPGNHVFRGDKAIFVAQYITGLRATFAVDGDPSQGNMIPFAQYLNEYTFSTVGGDQFENDYMTIIAETTDIESGSIFLDGSPLDTSIFTPILTTDYQAAIVPLMDGIHTTTSTNPHGITVEGFAGRESYLYPAGARLQFINPINDLSPPAVTIDGSGMGEASDSGPDDSGIFFIELSDDSVNLELTVDPSFVPADPVVTFMVALADESLVIGSGSVVVTDGSGNESVLQVTFTPGLCCKASGGNGCCNVDCAQKVCADDNSCCGVNGWTGSCAAKARTLCGDLCVNSGDNCCSTCLLSPCVDGATGADLYHPHCTEDGKFIQCSAWGQCFEKDCPGDTVWSEAASVCV